MGTLVCRIELDKHKGLILTVENDDDMITQTLVMDGTGITTTVAGPQQTSSIAQFQDSVGIRCQTFTIEAETIDCKSSGKTTHESGQDMELHSRQNLNVSADLNATHKAMNTTLESLVAAELKGATAKVEGATLAELKGATVKIEGLGMLSLKSGGVMDIKSSLINILGALNMG